MDQPSILSTLVASFVLVLALIVFDVLTIAAPAIPLSLDTLQREDVPVTPAAAPSGADASGEAASGEVASGDVGSGEVASGGGTSVPVVSGTVLLRGSSPADLVPDLAQGLDQTGQIAGDTGDSHGQRSLPAITVSIGGGAPVRVRWTSRSPDAGGACGWICEWDTTRLANGVYAVRAHSAASGVSETTYFRVRN